MINLFDKKQAWILGGFEYLHADDVVANAGSGGATFRTDQLGTGQHVPYTKLMSGTADDTAIIPGDATNGLYVNVKASALPSGAATAAKQPALGTAGTASADVITIQGIASMTAVKVDGSATAQPVTDNGGSLSVDDGGGSLTVDGSVTATGGAAHDAAVSGNPNLMGAYASASAPTDVSADGDAVRLWADRAGRLQIGDGGGNLSIDDGGNSITVDGTVAISGTVAVTDNSGSLSVDDNGGSLTVDGTVAISALPASTNTLEVVGDVAHDAAAAGNPVLIGAYASATAPTDVSANGDAVRIWADLAGRVQIGDGGSTLSVDDGAGSLTVDGTVAATQSGTWNVTNISGTVSLPTGAATAAKQPALGTAGTASADVITVQGIASMTALKVDGSAVTQPVSGTVTASNTAGVAAHDAAISGNPVRVAGRAGNVDYTAVANGDVADFLTDLNGKQIVMPYAVPENFVYGVTAAITGTSATEVLAAAGAGIRNYVTSLTISNSHATVGTVVEVRDGTTTVMHRGYAAPAGSGYTITFPVPLRGTANTAVNVYNITTGANVYASASGYKAP